MLIRACILVTGIMVTLIFAHYFSIMPAISAYKVAIFTAVPFGTGMIIGWMR